MERRLRFTKAKHGSEGEYNGNVDAEGHPHGNGVMLWGSGDSYDGQWENGVMHGRGRYTWAKNKGVYDGQWCNGEMAGTGTLDNKDGHHEGLYKDGQKHGHGQQIWKDGSIYDGNYNEGQRHGEGRYKWGRLKWHSDFETGPLYKGQWQGGDMSGSGTYRTPWGSVYTGEFHAGEYHGHGTFEFENGDVSSGGWSKGMRHGGCAYWYKDGKQGTVEFEEDCPIEYSGTGTFEDSTNPKQMFKLRDLVPRKKR